MSRRSFLVGSIILLAWITTMVGIYRDRTAQVAPDKGLESKADFFTSVKPAEKWQDIEDYMLVIQADKPGDPGTIVGAAATSLRLNNRPTSTSAYHAEFHLEARLSALLPVAKVKGSAQLDKDANLTSFYAVADISKLQFSGQGEVVRKQFYIKTSNGSDISYLKKSLPAPVSLGEVFQPAMGRRLKIATGEKLSTPIVDPLSGRNLGVMTLEVKNQETISLDGESIQAYRITSDLSGVQTEMWVDEKGNTLRRNLINGLRMDRTTKEKALKTASSLTDPITPPAMVLSEFPASNTGAAESDESQSSPLSGVLGIILR